MDYLAQILSVGRYAHHLEIPASLTNLGICSQACHPGFCSSCTFEVSAAVRVSVPLAYLEIRFSCLILASARPEPLMFMHFLHPCRLQKQVNQFYVKQLKTTNIKASPLHAIGARSATMLTHIPLRQLMHGCQAYLQVLRRSVTGNPALADRALWGERRELQSIGGQEKAGGIPSLSARHVGPLPPPLPSEKERIRSTFPGVLKQTWTAVQRFSSKLGSLFSDAQANTERCPAMVIKHRPPCRVGEPERAVGAL